MKQILDFTLIEKQDYGPVAWLRLQSPSALPEIRPGQFLQMRVDGSQKTYLRRPISIHSVDKEQNSVELLIAKVGEGTRTLTALPVGSTINMLLPLGNGFTLPEHREERVLLVAGGMGIAPMYQLAKEVNAMGLRPTFLFGGKKASDLVRLETYEPLGELCVIMEDGSLGEKGLITQHSVLQREFDKVYVCGSRGMERAVVKLARERGWWCEVSIDNKMACGLGACLCCVEDTVDGNLCVCKEGPVFNERRLKW